VTGHFLLSIFWHKSRRQFVDVTVTDASYRAKASHADLMGLVGAGYAAVQLQRGADGRYEQVWSITDKGKRLAHGVA
jgi:hypothetical protein